VLRPSTTGGGNHWLCRRFLYSDILRRSYDFLQPHKKDRAGSTRVVPRDAKSAVGLIKYFPLLWRRDTLARRNPGHKIKHFTALLLGPSFALHYLGCTERASLCTEREAYASFKAPIMESSPCRWNAGYRAKCGRARARELRGWARAEPAFKQQSPYPRVQSYGRAKHRPERGPHDAGYSTGQCRSDPG
jgi:hypothetical protein